MMEEVSLELFFDVGLGLWSIVFGYLPKCEFLEIFVIVVIVVYFF